VKNKGGNGNIKMACDEILRVMKGNMKKVDLLPRMYSEVDCQGDMISVCHGRHSIPFPIKSMIVPITCTLQFVDSEHRWDSEYDHELHGEMIRDVEEVIEQWYNEARTKKFYQSWSEADVVMVEKDKVMSYYDQVKKKCQETKDDVWCQYVTSDDHHKGSFWEWIVVMMCLLLIIIIFWYLWNKKITSREIDEQQQLRETIH
jgi:hypothetical protein